MGIKILANDGLNAKGIEILTQHGFEVDTNTIAQDQLADAISNYEVLLVRSATKVTKEIINAGNTLKLIGRGGVGIDNIDVIAANEKGIKVVNTPAASSLSVAELVFAHLYSGCRFLGVSNRNLPTNPNGLFKELKNKASKGKEIKGKTLGIFGIGRIGQEIAKIAIANGMNVLAYDPFVSEVTLQLSFHEQMGLKPIDVILKTITKEQVLQNADFLTINIPGGSEPVLSQSDIHMCKKGIGIINCARGGVVLESDLIQGLESGKIAFVGLDVFESEPPVNDFIFKQEQISVSPHIGAATVEAQERIGVEMAHLIIQFFNK